MLKINHLAVRPEHVEGRMANYDTVSMGRGEACLPVGRGEGPHFLMLNFMIKECEKKVVRKPKRKTLPLKDRRKGFSPVEFGLMKEEAIKEARRCLGLRECESCEICSLLCPDLCITKDEKTGEVLIDLDYCKGCAICASVCPKGAIKMVLEEGG